MTFDIQERIVLGMYRYEDYTTTVNSPEEQAVLDDLKGILTVGPFYNARWVANGHFIDLSAGPAVARLSSSQRSNAASMQRTC